MVLNTQRREGITTPQQNGAVEVINVWETIQGEGPFSGCPSVFIRLAGCNLRCPFCDTDYTTNRRMMEATEVVELVRGIRQSGLVVLTGGEPMRQDIGPLIDELLAKDFIVQIETNGTLYRDNIAYDQIAVVCSPKAPKVHPELIPHVTAWKYVIQSGHVDEVDGLPTKTLGGFAPAKPPWDLNPLIYIQPMDAGDYFQNKENTKASIDVCLRFNYRLQVQIQKIIGVP